MIKMRDNHDISGGKSGFSLITVLMISLVGMFLVGGMMYTFQSFAGKSAVVLSDTVLNNILEDGVERGKAALKARMMNTDPPPRWTDKPGLGVSSDIDSVETLLLEDGTVYTATQNLFGKTANITVEIFDMQYDPEENAVNITDPEELKLIPHSLMLSASKDKDVYTDDIIWEPGGHETTFIDVDNGGAYLIRATLEVLDSGNREVKILEAAVVQTNLM
jgi:flagellar basal body-associated protein FliL